MKILSDLKQLQGSIITDVFVEDGMESKVVILTEDKAVAVIDTAERTSYGVMSFESKLQTDELDVFMQFEDILLHYGFINEDDVIQYEKEIEEKSQRELEERSAEERERNYQHYLKLKELFEGGSDS